jgi:hypothetical protein
MRDAEFVELLTRYIEKKVPGRIPRFAHSLSLFTRFATDNPKSVFFFLFLLLFCIIYYYLILSISKH